MASLYWHNLNASNDANDRTNYSTDQAGTIAAGAGALTADDLFFNGTGTGSDDNWSTSANLTINSIDFTGYAGDALSDGWDITIAPAAGTIDAIFTGSWTYNYPDTEHIILDTTNGNIDLYINTTIPTLEMLGSGSVTVRATDFNSRGIDCSTFTGTFDLNNSGGYTNFNVYNGDVVLNLDFMTILCTDGGALNMWQDNDFFTGSATLQDIPFQIQLRGTHVLTGEVNIYGIWAANPLCVISGSPIGWSGEMKFNTTNDGWVYHIDNDLILRGTNPDIFCRSEFQEMVINGSITEDVISRKLNFGGSDQSGRGHVLLTSTATPTHSNGTQFIDSDLSSPPPSVTWNRPDGDAVESFGTGDIDYQDCDPQIRYGFFNTATSGQVRELTNNINGLSSDREVHLTLHAVNSNNVATPPKLILSGNITSTGGTTLLIDSFEYNGIGEVEISNLDFESIDRIERIIEKDSGHGFYGIPVVRNLTAIPNFFGACTIEANIDVTDTASFQAIWALGSGAYRLYMNGGNWLINDLVVTGEAVTLGPQKVAVDYNAGGQAIEFRIDDITVWSGTGAAGTGALTDFFIGARRFAGVLGGRFQGIIQDFEISGSSVMNFTFGKGNLRLNLGVDQLPLSARNKTFVNISNEGIDQLITYRAIDGGGNKNIFFRRP